MILISQEVFCQRENRLILKFAPLGLIETYGKNIHVGAEFLSKGQYTFETDFAVYSRTSEKNKNFPRIKDRTGFKIKPEIRYYLKTKKENARYRGFYIANELFFISDNFKRGDTYIHYDTPLDTSYMYKAYEKIRRFELGDNLKIGYQSVTKIKLTFDYYFGLGLKYYNGSVDNKIIDPICCPVMRFFELPVFKGIRPSLTFGIKLGFVL